MHTRQYRIKMTKTTPTARKLFRDVYQKLLTTLQIFIRCARRSVLVTVHKLACVDLNLNILWLCFSQSLSASGFSFILASINFVTSFYKFMYCLFIMLISICIYRRFFDDAFHSMPMRHRKWKKTIRRKKKLFVS